MPGRIDDYDRGAAEGVRFEALEKRLPRSLRRHLLHFEAAIEDAVRAFAAGLPEGARVLDAGAGECKHRPYFKGRRYTAVDSGVGDAAWDYGKLDALADLTWLPFANERFDACLNVVTLEHVKDPAQVIREIARSLTPGGRLLLIVPFEWEEHQQPHDYFRFTRYSLAYLLKKAGLEAESIKPVGGFFRLMSRRMFSALQFFPGPLIFIGAIFFVPPALLLPLLEPLDRQQNFTLGYICSARKSG